MKFKTGFFNPRLWWEGMKRLRVLGFGVAFLSMTVSALIPAVNLVNDLTAEYHYGWEPSIRTLQVNGYCIPLAFLPWLMPIFVLVMFSFLFKRKESDFYHAIPYTRTCVYTTYTVAVLTWVWGITALCALVSGILWAVNPYVIFSVGALARWAIASGLAATLLCAIMLLAMSICGNIATTLLNFLVFAALPRIMCYLLAMMIESGVQTALLVPESFMGGFLMSEWFLPLSVLDYVRFGLDIGADFYNTPVYVYTAVMSVLILVGAGFCYRRRKSETAGNSAPSNRMQHVFRIIFSLPFVLIAAVAWVGNDRMIACIMVVVSLLIYYLYELITTKQIKRLWNATPYLGVLFACCLVFLGIYQFISFGVLHWKIEPEDIQTVEFIYPYSYEDRAVWGEESAGFFSESAKDDTDSFFPMETSDENVIRYVAESLKKTQLDLRKTDPFYRAQVNIRLKNGMVITRRIWADNEDLRSWFLNIPEYREQLLVIPNPEDVTKISYAGSDFETQYHKSNPKTPLLRSIPVVEDEKAVSELYEIFYREYHMLDYKDQYRLRILIETMKASPDSIGFYVKYDSDDYIIEGSERFYVTPELCPETYAWLYDYFLKDAVEAIQ